MVTLDQSAWDLLFGWMQEGQCMIPEGCTVPPLGILFYAVVVAVIVGLVYAGLKGHLPEKLDSLLNQ